MGRVGIGLILALGATPSADASDALCHSLRPISPTFQHTNTMSKNTKIEFTYGMFTKSHPQAEYAQDQIIAKAEQVCKDLDKKISYKGITIKAVECSIWTNEFSPGIWFEADFSKSPWAKGVLKSFDKFLSLKYMGTIIGKATYDWGYAEAILFGKYNKNYQKLKEAFPLIDTKGSKTKFEGIPALAYNLFNKSAKGQMYHTIRTYKAPFEFHKDIKPAFAHAYDKGNPAELSKVYAQLELLAYAYYHEIVESLTALAEFVQEVDMSVIDENVAKHLKFDKECSKYGIDSQCLLDAMANPFVDLDAFIEIADVIIKHAKLHKSNKP